jgi:hypothetical protein
MICPEKETLQRSCTDAWNRYEASIGDRMSQLQRDAPARLKMAGSIARMLATGTGAFHLSLEHAKASHALSKHLVTHRC